MKKLLLMLLCCCILCLALPAMAETVSIANGAKAYDISLTLPAGAKLTQNDYMEDSDLTAAVVTFDDATLPTYRIMIAYDELFGDSSFSDMDEEAQKSFYQYAVGEFTDPSYETRDLPDGDRIMILNEGGTSDFAYVMTVHHGYFVSIYIAYEDYAQLSTADVERAVTLIDGVSFTPAAQ